MRLLAGAPALRSISQCYSAMETFPQEASQGTGVPQNSLEKCCTTPCFYWKEEVELGTSASGTVGRGRGVGVTNYIRPSLAPSTYWGWEILPAQCFCQLTETTLGPNFLSGLLVFSMIEPW